MDKVADFQQKLLTDAEARKEFAADPAAFLKRHSITLPAGTKLPASIPEATLDSAVNKVREKLTERGLDLEKIESADSTSISKLVEQTFKPKSSKADLAQIKAKMDEFDKRQATAPRKLKKPGRDESESTADQLVTYIPENVDPQTIAVVVAVVAIPVAVFGATNDSDPEVDPEE